MQNNPRAEILPLNHPTEKGVPCEGPSQGPTLEPSEPTKWSLRKAFGRGVLAVLASFSIRCFVQDIWTEIYWTLDGLVYRNTAPDIVYDYDYLVDNSAEYLNNADPAPVHHGSMNPPPQRRCILYYPGSEYCMQDTYLGLFFDFLKVMYIIFRVYCVISTMFYVRNLVRRHRARKNNPESYKAVHGLVDPVLYAFLLPFFLTFFFIGDSWKFYYLGCVSSL